MITPAVAQAEEMRQFRRSLKPADDGLPRPDGRRRLLFEEERAPCGVSGLGVVANRLFRYKTDFPADLSDCVVSRPRPWMLVIWEPLRTKAPSPPKAAAWCCYIQTVIFYHSPYIASPWVKLYPWRGRINRNSSPGHFEEWDTVETRLAGEDVVAFEGERFVCGGGSVVWKRGRWWAVRTARREAASR